MVNNALYSLKLRLPDHSLSEYVIILCTIATDIL